jgi:hypothetical protein
MRRISAVIASIASPTYEIAQQIVRVELQRGLSSPALEILGQTAAEFGFDPQRASRSTRRESGRAPDRM